MFVDDTVLSLGEKNYDNIVSIMNTELEMLRHYLRQNTIKLNASKTKSMVLGSRVNCKTFLTKNFVLQINVANTSMVSEIKCLAVWLDS